MGWHLAKWPVLHKHLPVTLLSQGGLHMQSSQSSRTCFTHAFHKSCHDWAKQCSAWMRKGRVLPHCTNLYLRLDNLIVSWESRCLSGQEVQCRGGYGLRLSMMPGKSFITFHFYGSVVEQKGRRKTAHVCLDLSKRCSLNQKRLGYRTPRLPGKYHTEPRPKARSDHLSTSVYSQECKVVAATLPQTNHFASHSSQETKKILHSFQPLSPWSHSNCKYSDSWTSMVGQTALGLGNCRWRNIR